MADQVDLANPQLVFFDLGETLITGNRQWASGAKSVLERFSGSDFGVGVISNTGSFDKTEILAHLPVDFSWAPLEENLVILSGEVGFKKPDPEIFRLALERAAVPANACLFCTENLQHILVAQSLGYKTVRIAGSPEEDLVLMADFFLGAN